MSPTKITVPSVRARKVRTGSDPLVMVTAYDAPGARMADVVRMLHHHSAREINDGILESVQRFAADTPQRDDFTLVTVKRV